MFLSVSAYWRCPLVYSAAVSAVIDAAVPGDDFEALEAMMYESFSTEADHGS